MDQSILHVLEPLHDIQESSGNLTWNIDRKTGQCLYAIVRKHEFKHVLEIGTSIGISALWLAGALRETGGHLTTIESHAERFAMAETNIIAAKATDIITQVQGHAPEILTEIPGTFDMMFFDATKYEHQSYVEALASRLEPGGVIITDNISTHAKSLAPYRTYMEGNPMFVTTFVDIGNGLLISEKV